MILAKKWGTCYNAIVEIVLIYRYSSIEIGKIRISILKKIISLYYRVEAAKWILTSYAISQ